MSEGAADLWRKLAPELIECGLLAEADVPALILMAEHFAVARKAARIIARDGLVAVDENGCIRKHPVLQVLRDHSTAFRLYAAEFGLMPSARARLHIAPLEDEPDLAELLFSPAQQVEDD